MKGVIGADLYQFAPAGRYCRLKFDFLFFVIYFHYLERECMFHVVLNRLEKMLFLWFHQKSPMRYVPPS